MAHGSQVISDFNNKKGNLISLGMAPNNVRSATYLLVGRIRTIVVASGKTGSIQFSTLLTRLLNGRCAGRGVIQVSLAVFATAPQILPEN